MDNIGSVSETLIDHTFFHIEGKKIVQEKIPFFVTIGCSCFAQGYGQSTTQFKQVNEIALE